MLVSTFADARVTRPAPGACAMLVILRDAEETVLHRETIIY
jgi:hypothetical protein